MVAEQDLHSLVVFRLGRDGFALPVETVSEVVPLAWLARPPNMPSFVSGILNLGGIAVPVLRTDILLGVSEAAFGLESSILIMKGGAGPLGLLVSHVEGVRPASAWDRLPVAAEHSFHGCVSARLEGPQEGLHLIAWEQVLLREERLRLDEFQRQTQARLEELVDLAP